MGSPTGAEVKIQKKKSRAPEIQKIEIFIFSEHVNIIFDQNYSHYAFYINLIRWIIPNGHQERPECGVTKGENDLDFEIMLPSGQLTINNRPFVTPHPGRF